MTIAIHQPLVLSILFLTLSGCSNTPSNPDLYTNRKFPQPRPVSKVIQAAPKTTYTAPVQAPAASFDSSNYTDRFEVQSFIEQMVLNHGFSRSYLTGLFAEAKQLPSVIRLENGSDHSPGPPKPRLGSWTRYRANFLTEQHIRNGVEFWTNNATAIQKASNTYGVDPEYIVGIIGVETFFGRNIGKTCVFDALTTLAFDTKRRAPYFRTELEHFLLMTREEGYQPRKLVGSWAGAMGLGQFMPSSFRRLAVDFDHNGRRDLWQAHDAIGSVAHYFSKNGWQFNNPVAEQAYGTGDKSIIDLSTYEGNEYWQTYPNFKVIKRYNNSKKYAMAVHQLAQAIKQRLPVLQSFRYDQSPGRILTK